MGVRLPPRALRFLSLIFVPSPFSAHPLRLLVRQIRRGPPPVVLPMVDTLGGHVTLGVIEESVFFAVCRNLLFVAPYRDKQTESALNASAEI